MNTLYYGDNLDILRRYVADESVDLIYLDPPFKSDQNYNVLFAEQDGARSASQIQAFEDTWQWDQAAAAAYEEVVEQGGQVSLVMQAFRTAIGDSNMLAYLSMMAPRLVELRRVLRESGSIYLHCDPTASHYLKLLMDAVFGPSNFRNEIIWKRTYAHSGQTRWGPVHDTLLFYGKSDNCIWNRVLQSHGEEYVSGKYRYQDDRGRYRLVVLTGPGVRDGESGREWNGYNPTSIGRHWAVPKTLLKSVMGCDPPKTMCVHDSLQYLDDRGFIHWPTKKGGMRGAPEVKRYLDEGAPIQDVITDIWPINSQAAERLGYPTQKPEALLERIIQASSNEGDIVLDPFCGCGTATAAAQKLGRQWIGIDITHLAITLIKHRLQKSFGEIQYKTIGEPVDVAGAESLAAGDKYQFQWWALGLVGARPNKGEQKKGADRGIDGRLYFHDEAEGSKTKQVVLSVKGGKLKADDIRALGHVVEREKATIGALLTIQEPSKGMRADAASAGFYDSPWGTKHPKLQILTVGELLEGKKLDLPPSRDFRTFKDAPKAKRQSRDKQHELPGF